MFAFNADLDLLGAHAIHVPNS